MSCKDKDGGSHHNACDCREAYVKKLEAVAKAAKTLIKCMGMRRHLLSLETSESVDIGQLCFALEALKESR